MSAERHALPAWRVLADDLTGALDTAAVLGAGAPLPVYLGRPPAGTAGPALVATASRDVAPAELPGQLQPALDWLAGPGPAYKKIDSLLRGNTFAELAWLQAARPERFRHVVFAPAYPRQGRFTAGDRHWVEGQPDAGFPGSLRAALESHGLRVIAGADLADCLARAGDTPALLLPEVGSQAALDAIADHRHDAAAGRWLWAGSAGLAEALARSTAAAAEDSPLRRATPPLLLATCSRHPVLREQLRRLRLARPAAGGALQIHDFSETRPLPADEAHALLQSRARQLTGAGAARPGLLLVVGGDTLLALCRASGARSLRAGPGPRAGWGRAVLQGGTWDGLTCLSRSGAFGAPDELTDLIDTLSPLKETTA